MQCPLKLSSRSRHKGLSTTTPTKVQSPWRSIIRKMLDGLHRRAQALRLVANQLNLVVPLRIGGNNNSHQDDDECMSWAVE